MNECVSSQIQSDIVNVASEVKNNVNAGETSEQPPTPIDPISYQEMAGSARSITLEVPLTPPAQGENAVPTPYVDPSLSTPYPTPSALSQETPRESTPITPLEVELEKPQTAPGTVLEDHDSTDGGQYPDPSPPPIVTRLVNRSQYVQFPSTKPPTINDGSSHFTAADTSAEGSSTTTNTLHPYSSPTVLMSPVSNGVVQKETLGVPPVVTPPVRTTLGPPETSPPPARPLKKARVPSRFDLKTGTGTTTVLSTNLPEKRESEERVQPGEENLSQGQMNSDASVFMELGEKNPLRRSQGTKPDIGVSGPAGEDDRRCLIGVDRNDMKYLTAFSSYLAWLERDESLQNQIWVIPFTNFRLSIPPYLTGLTARWRQIRYVCGWIMAKTLRLLPKVPELMIRFANQLAKELIDTPPDKMVTSLYHRIFGESAWGFIGFLIALWHYRKFLCRVQDIKDQRIWNREHESSIRKLLDYIHKLDQNHQNEVKRILTYNEKVFREWVSETVKRNILIRNPLLKEKEKEERSFNGKNEPKDEAYGNLGHSHIQGLVHICAHKYSCEDTYGSDSSLMQIYEIFGWVDMLRNMSALYVSTFLGIYGLCILSSIFVLGGSSKLD